ncbi:dynein regulatory complex subunit 7 [Anabrus simplex]|uniref:dynein regulatory complex subunit 7 n=1 Tax=Anabrus simplex TaxID=316456 RepID=UPI0035A3A681
MSTLLCSFLVGNYYRAYVVCGYATREVCFNDLTREENPILLLLAKEEEPEEPPEVESKYKVKPPRDLRSKYLLEMEALKQAKLDEEERIRKEKEQQEIEEFERPPPDELYALRIHSWIVVLPGTRDVTEPFFIESSTGNRCELSDKQYLGLESLWDHTNYWVNLQECSQGCKDLKFDLTDLTCWEHLLLGEPWETRRLGEMEDESPEILQEKHLDMPDSWVQPIDIPHSVFKKRYAGGGKQALYKKSKLEKYAPYETRDGLVSRATMYSEYEWESPEWLVEIYSMRADLLEQARQDFKAETIWQKFGRGREDGLKEHTFFVAASSVEDSRLMEFYSEARIDGLERLEMHPLYLTETFKGRRDRLFYRHVTFAPRQRGTLAAMEGPRRVVLKLVEKFERDPSKKANDDIATKTFAIADNEIHLKYHYDDERITAQTRVFIKPSLAEMGDQLKFNPQLTYGYMVSPTDPFAKQYDLFYLLEQLLKDEEKSLFLVREIEDEVASILKTRSVELAVPKLQVSIFDKERNDMYREAMKLRDKQFKELSAREVEKDIDYLSPCLARLGSPEYLTREQAKEVREETIKSFKQTMVERATYLQSKFEKASQALQERHQWYEEEQDNLTQEEEEEYFTFSNEMAFYLHTLDIQLNRHKELAPVRYAALDSALRSDPRLAILYW